MFLKKRVNRNELLIILLPLIILAQVRSSFTWSLSFEITAVLVFLTAVVSMYDKRITFPNKLVAFTLYISVIVFLIINFQVSSLVSLLIFISIFHIEEKTKQSSLYNLTTILSCIIAVSLLSWLLHFNGIFIFPKYNHLDLSIIGNEGYLENYILFLHHPIQTTIPRFYSIFEEPGDLALLLVFVIAANRFNFKDKRVFILFLGLIFTYSLTGYLVFIFGLIAYKIKDFKTLIIVLIISVIIISVLYFLLKDVDAINLMIIERIINFEEKGLDSRVTDDLNSFYESFYLSIDSLLGMGKGYAGIHFNGASYKFFIIDYGWIGVFALLLIYISIMFAYKKRNFVFLSMYALAFLPLYKAFLAWQIILFSLTYSKNNSCK